jgi:hypothetical protein
LIQPLARKNHLRLLFFSTLATTFCLYLVLGGGKDISLWSQVVLFATSCASCHRYGHKWCFLPPLWSQVMRFVTAMVSRCDSFHQYCVRFATVTPTDSVFPTTTLPLLVWLHCFSNYNKLHRTATASLNNGRLFCLVCAGYFGPSTSVSINMNWSHFTWGVSEKHPYWVPLDYFAIS